MFVNPYKILGVPNGSDKSVCKKAFRKLCAKYHPDNGGDEEMFHKVNEAWKQIESGVFNDVVSIKRRPHVRHKTLFSYEVA